MRSDLDLKENDPQGKKLQMQEILRNIREMKKLYDSTILWLNERLENF